MSCRSPATSCARSARPRHSRRPANSSRPASACWRSSDMAATLTVPSPARFWARPWARFGIRRLRRLLVSLWILVTASFAMIHLIPGDPVRAARGPTAPADLVAARRHSLGLDDPFFVQYLHYLKGLFTGDLGTSLASQLPVSDVVAQRLPATLSQTKQTNLAAVVVAVPLGVATGVLTR